MSSGASQGPGEEPQRQGARGARPGRLVGRDAAAGGAEGARHGRDLSPAELDEFAQNFRSSYRTLWTIAAGIVNDPAIAEDVVQEAALTAISKLHEFEPHSNYTAWMAKIVRFLALNQARRGRRQPANVDPVAMDDSLKAREEAGVSEADVSGVEVAGVDSVGRLDVQRSPFDDRVLHALNSVSDIARACLLLRTIRGLNYDEISRALDIPPGTAMSHVHRTRMVLRERLAELDPALRNASKDQPERGSASA